MSAASFIGMAGTLYLAGYDGLAFVMGWTGGYVLVALFLAPYLRKFGQFTIPDFLGTRYNGNLPRTIGVIAAIICSFTYVVAQIYGVGIITARLTGIEFQVRRFRRPGRHPGVFLPRGHARGDLDPGGAVHHPDHRLHDPGGVAVGISHWQSDSADRLRPGAAAGDGTGKHLQQRRPPTRALLEASARAAQQGEAGSLRSTPRSRQPAPAPPSSKRSAQRQVTLPTSQPPPTPSRQRGKKSADGAKAKTGPVSAHATAFAGKGAEPTC
jgi:cation/acetate symporter